MTVRRRGPSSTGKVAVLDEHGAITGVDPQDIKEPVIPMLTISSDELSEFLWAGQYYQ